MESFLISFVFYTLLILIILMFAAAIYRYIRFRRQVSGKAEADHFPQAGWVKTSGSFTGRYQDENYYSRSLARQIKDRKFELLYYANDRSYFVWYSFAPLPHPAEIESGTSVTLYYEKKHPTNFKITDFDPNGY